MRKAIHHVSSRHETREDASDALAAVTHPSVAAHIGLEAAWIDHENRVHTIVTNVRGLDQESDATLPKGNRIVWLADAA